MTDRELWDRINGKPWAPQGLALKHGCWERLSPESDDGSHVWSEEARALIRVACEDWLDANRRAWQVYQRGNMWMGCDFDIAAAADGFDRTETTVALCELVAAKPKRGVGSIVGEWPGDETDEEADRLLKEVE